MLGVANPVNREESYKIIFNIGINQAMIFLLNNLWSLL